MELSLVSLMFVLAAMAAAVMGFAVQRGATCAVAAVEEIVSRRGCGKLAAMLEAALWVAVGLGVAKHLHWLGALPSGHELTGWTVLGAAILGIGAFVNGACVIGTLARLGSGEWAYAAAPLGYLLGCLSAPIVFAAPAALARPGESIMFAAASLATWPLLMLMAWRFVKLFWRADRSLPSALRAAAWSPHGATIVIGFAFLASLLLAGTWAYTDVLAELARGMFNSLPARAGLAVALLLGAMLGGWSAGRWQRTPISLGKVLRCLSGGVLMAWGSLLIPGSNDGLILVGMPLLWPYAWAAFLVMCLTVAGAIVTQDRFFRPRS